MLYPTTPLVGLAVQDSITSWVAVPARVEVCVLPATLLLLSVTTSVPLRLPAAAGVNNTAIVQVVFAPKVAPQVVSWLKSPGLLPTKPMLVILKGALPVLLRVKLSGELLIIAGWLVKLKLAGERAAIGTVPVPVKLTDCGLFVALSAKVNVAVRLPDVVGVNVTLTVQLAFAASELPHVLLGILKSPGSVPITWMLLMVKAAFPPLVRVTPCAALVVPTLCEPKDRAAAERLMAADVPVPTRLTAWGLPAVALSATVNHAVRFPEAEGVNATEIVQEPFAATEPGASGQVVISLKSLALAPVTEMPVMVKLVLPVLVRVTVSAVLVVSTL